MQVMSGRREKAKRRAAEIAYAEFFERFVWEHCSVCDGWGTVPRRRVFLCNDCGVQLVRGANSAANRKQLYDRIRAAFRAA